MTDRLEEWDRCAPWLQAALNHAGNTHSLDDVRRMVKEGRAHFWPFPQCVLVTEFIEYPRFRSLNVWLGGGDDLGGLLRLLPAFERWSVEHGCRRMEISGRKGWLRMLPGFRAASETIIKELVP